MKSVGLLLCVAFVALPSDIAASIFRRQYYPSLDGLVVQPLDYINQNQQRPFNQQNLRQSRGHNSQARSQNENSEETRERSDYDASEDDSGYVLPLAGITGESRVTNLRKTVQDNTIMPVYSDLVSWKGINMASSKKNPINKKAIEKIFSEAYKTMKHFSEEDKKTFHENYMAASQDNNENTRLNATQMIQKNNYVAEEHTVKTDDGYLLTMFRIPAARASRKAINKPVVLLMHGLLGSADDWLLMGSGKSLAFLLSDAGYDVWMGNARGNKYSRRHVSKHPAMPDFWQFSNDEIALHDLPAMIDHVLDNTSQQKLTYVGIDQGTTALFALVSTIPEYNDKINMMYALSPMAFMSNVRSPMLRMIAPTSPLSQRLQEQLGRNEFRPSKELIKTLGGSMCEKQIGCKNVCSNLNIVMSGINLDQLDTELIPVIMSHLPAGGSVKQIKQIGQAIANQEFRMYDYGVATNELIYGSEQAPRYDWSRVRVPVSLIYSEADWMAHPMDVERLRKELPEVRDVQKVPIKDFTRIDFQFSKNAPQVVYKKMIESMQQSNNLQF